MNKKHTVKKENSDKTKEKWYKKILLTTWLTIFGSVTIFFSWIVEKNFQSEWTNQKESLKRSQIVIDIVENRRTMYEIALSQEELKAKPDSTLIAHYQQRLSRAYMDLLSWNKARVTDDKQKNQKLIQAKHLFDDDNLANFEKGNYKKIKENFNFALAVFGEYYMKLDGNFSKKYDEVLENENFWTNILTYSYIIGSVLLGIGYILEKKSKQNDK